VAFEPFYDSYATSAILAGAKLVPVTLQPPDWSYEIEALQAAISPRTRVLLLNTPHNPTGKVFTRGELKAIAALAIERDLLVITDEVYDRITYDGAKHISLATLPGMWERTLTINSFGKTFSMTGWKLGFALGPASLNAAVRAVHQFVTFASATPFQDAMALALETAEERGYYQTLAREYTERRDFLREALEESGLPALPVSGSYFLMADFSHLDFAV
jgi:aspartate/methionine/tyrosine aminotransferase